MSSDSKALNAKCKFYFYYPHRQKISGGLFYFYSLADAFAKLEYGDVFVVNYRNSDYFSIFSKGNSISDKIKQINYEDSYRVKDEENVYLFAYLNMLPLMLESFKHLKRAKVFIINFHPHSPQILNENLEITDKKDLHELYNMFAKNNAIAFMDRACMNVVSACATEPFNSHFIPAFVSSTYQQYKNDSYVKTGEVRVGCVCRLDVDKIYTVINLLDNLFSIKSEGKICVHIIGDGDSRHLINPQKYETKLNIIFTSYMYGDKLREYMRDNIDVVFNFGVAALDAASQGLPVVVPPFDRDVHSIDKYVFLCDMKHYVLGCDPCQYETLGINAHSISEVLDAVYRNEGKSFWGEKCYKYLTENHLIDKSIMSLRKYIMQTDLTISKCLNNHIIREFVNKFAKAKRNHFDWDLYCRNGRKSSVLRLKWNVIANSIKLIIYAIAYAIAGKSRKIKRACEKIEKSMGVLEELNELKKHYECCERVPARRSN